MEDAVVLYHPNVSHFFEYARWDWKKGLNKFGGSYNNYSPTEGSSTFHGNQDNVYEKYANHNVKDGASLVDKMAGELKTLDFSEVKWVFRQMLEDGDSVDINRYLEGNERCWTGVRRQSRNRKVIRIYTAMGGNCSRSKKEIAVNGALAVTLCEILESIGIGVEMFAAMYTCRCGVTPGKPRDLLEVIKVKDVNEFADMGMMNYVTGDAHVFRNTGFRNWCRRMAEVGADTDGGLGYYGEINSEMLEGAVEGECDGTVIIPSIYDIDVAKKWIVNKLNSMGDDIRK